MRSKDDNNSPNGFIRRRLYRPQLNNDQLCALVAYKNRGVDLSITYRLVLSTVYDHLIGYVPLWAAPNLITLFGFVLAFLGHLAVVLHTPTFTEPMPRWSNLCAGIGLLSYMVLDNLDGRQARRTRSSSPLGHLFDHGCDALNVTLSAMALAATLRLGPLWATGIVLLGQTTLLTATLEELFTGAMVLREINGPNEGIITIVSIQLAAAVYGSGLWDRPVLLSFPFGMYPTTTGRIAATVASVGGARSAVQSLVAVAQHIGLLAMIFRVVPRVISFVLYLVTYTMWAMLAPTVYQMSVRSALWTAGFFVFDLVSRTILVHLTGTAPFPYVPPLLLFVLLPPSLGLLTQDSHAATHVAILSSALALGAAFIGAVWRASCIVEQLCQFLNVFCFRLGPRKSKIVPAEDVTEVHRVHGLATKEGAKRKGL